MLHTCFHHLCTRKLFLPGLLRFQDKSLLTLVSFIFVGARFVAPRLQETRAGFIQV